MRLIRQLADESHFLIELNLTAFDGLIDPLSLITFTFTLVPNFSKVSVGKSVGRLKHLVPALRSHITPRFNIVNFGEEVRII